MPGETPEQPTVESTAKKGRLSPVPKRASRATRSGCQDIPKPVSRDGSALRPRTGS
jgi:hypothetical protein